MSKLEEIAAIARTNEESASKEVQAVLAKYNVSIHFAESRVDGNTVQANMFFRFNPNSFLSPQPQKVGG